MRMKRRTRRKSKLITSPACRALIEALEGFRAHAYLPTPEDVPTIGYGHTKGVKMGDICTKAEADIFLSHDLHEAEAAVDSKVKVPISQDQFDALVSFTFNMGAGSLGSSTLLKMLNVGDYLAAADQFLVWDKQHGKILNGLTERRRKERLLFLT